MDILKETKMQDNKGITTPMDSSASLTLDSQAPTIDASEYHRIVGKLQYFSLTRPYISFCVNKLS